MSEENTNTTIPATLSPGEPLISEDTAKKFQAFADEIINNTPEESEEVVEASEPEEELVEENEPNVILAAEPTEDQPALTQVANGVIGSGVVKKKTTKKTEPKVEEEDLGDTLAVFSSRNLHWPGVGSLLRGYSVIPAKIAEKWVSRNKNVRLATPEEVAEGFTK